MPSASLRTRSYVVLAVAAVLAYWGSAMALGESYPLSQLMMFSVPEHSASRVLVRDADGRVSEVAAFDRWRCDPNIDLSGRCSPGFSAQDELVMEIIRQRPGSSALKAQGVTLVRRVFTIEGVDRQLAVEQCDITTCTARRIDP